MSDDATIDDMHPGVEIAVTKASVFVPYSTELLDDRLKGASFHFGPRTPEEQAEFDRWRQEQAELRAAGLLDDEGDQIKPTECPACYTIADGTAAGWNGPLGDSLRCERPRGHDGDHLFTVLWGDEDRPNRDEESS